MKVSFLCTLLCVAFSLSGFAADTEPTIKHFVVNDLDVYLVNTHDGNGVALQTNVQVGSNHDEPLKMAGRAHYFEHVIHAGSKKYPGQHTVWRMRAELGSDANASTSGDRTIYYDYVHNEALEGAIKIQGAMISNPSWDPKIFAAEKLPVKNEALEYQGTDDDALLGTMSLHLLPRQHPLAKFQVGNQQQLNDMTIEDLKELYYSNYVSGSLQIIVAGNFDQLADGTVPLDELKVLKLLEQNFFPADIRNDPAGFKAVTQPLRKTAIPPLVSSEHKLPRFIEIGTQQPNRSLVLRFDVNHNYFLQNQAVIETLGDYLNMRIKNSFENQLLRSGLANKLSVSVETLNNAAYLNVIFGLTKKGSENRTKIVSEFFAFLHEIKTDGMASEVLEYLKTRNISMYQNQSRNPKWAADAVATSLTGLKAPMDVFKLKERFGNLVMEDIKAAATAIFDTNKMIGAYMGPEILSNSKSLVFERPILFPDVTHTFNQWKEALEKGLENRNFSVKEKLVLPSIKLNLASVPNSVGPPRAPRVIAQDDPNINLVLEESHVVPAGAIALILTPPSVSARTLSAMKLFFIALQNASSSELDYFASSGVPTSMGAVDGTIQIRAEGNVGALPQTLNWFLDRLNSYIPTQKEFENAKNLLKSALATQDDVMAAQSAQLALNSIVDSNSFLVTETVNEIETLTYAEALSLRSIWQNRYDIGLSVQGDFTAKETQDLLTLIRKKLPPLLSEEQRLERRRIYTHLSNQTFWVPGGTSKLEGNIGVARMYQRGPKAGTREGIAWTLASQEIARSVFELNRAEKGLGYIHSATLKRDKEGNSLVFYGQTDSLERFPEIAEGWNEIFARIARGELSVKSLENLRKGYLREADLIPVSLLARALANYGDYRATGNPNLIPWIKAEAATLTGEEIARVAQKYATADRPYVEAISSRQQPACRVVLSADELRKQLR